MPTVYDPENLEKKEQVTPHLPPSDEGLRHITGITPEEEKGVDENAAAAQDLRNAEQPAQPHENQVGQGYTGAATQTAQKSRFRGLFRTRNRKIAVAGGLTAGIIAAIIAAFIALLPLKILHVVDNLQNRFYATSENAMQKETNQLLSRYIRTSLSKCKNVVDSSCNPYNGGSLVQNLYKGWRNAKLEEQLKTKYGLEFKYDNGNYYMKTPDIPGNGANMKQFMGSDITLDDFINESPEFKNVSRSEIRQAVKAAFEGETRYKSVMYKYKVGKLLEQKYGIKRCIIACNQQDDFADWKADKKRAFRLYLTQRVLQPRSELLELMMECVLSPSCTEKTVIEAKEQPYTADKSGCKEGCLANGEPASDEDKILRQKIFALAASYGSDKKALDVVYKELADKGFVRYISKDLLEKTVKTVLTQEGTETMGKYANKIGSKLPLIGAVITANNWVQTIDKMPAILQKLSYVANSTAMVDMFSMYRTHADEIKEGKVDSAMVGSFVTALGPGIQTDEGSEAQVGGTAEAEQTPLYHEIAGGGSSASGVASVFSKFFSGSALAQSASPTSYSCADSPGVPAGKLVCEDMNLNHKGWFQNLLTGIVNSPVWKNGIKPLSDLFAHMMNLINKILKYVCSIPVINLICDGILGLINQLLGFLTSAVQPLFKYISGFMLKVLDVNINMVTSRMSGGRTFDLVAGGADVSGNDFAHNGLGGVKLSDTQAQSNLSYFYNEQFNQYNQQPFLARLFDKNSPYSLTAKLALAMPSNYSSAANSSFTSFISSPATGLFSAFSSIFSHRAAAAGPTAWGSDSDPFGITQYGYPLDDPVFSMDPDKYWNTYCVSSSPNYLTDKWNQYAASHINRENQLPENTQTTAFGGNNKYGTNGCLLIQAAVGSAGAAFTSSVLSPDDLAGSQAGGSSSTPISPTPSNTNCTANGIVYPGQYSESQLNQIFGGPARNNPSELVSVNFLGSSLQVNKVVAPCLEAVAQDLASSSYKPSGAKGGIGCYRATDGQVGDRSYHVYGAACDINPNTNNYFSDGAPRPYNPNCPIASGVIDSGSCYDMPKDYINAFERHGFKWGGTFNSIKDYMHFEWHGASP